MGNCFLLDTHSFIWFFKGNSKLSHKAKELIDDESNTKFISIVSAWEMTIKQSKGSDFLDLGTTVDEFIQQKLVYNDFQVLPINLSHLKFLASLPSSEKHKDPFDRLLVAQAIAEDLELISCDSQLKNYSVKLVW
jgi:PIN domain nuclease of toxin-antitoxin system